MELERSGTRRSQYWKNKSRETSPLTSMNIASVPSLHHSIIPLFHYSIIPTFHRNTISTNKHY